MIRLRPQVWRDDGTCWIAECPKSYTAGAAFADCFHGVHRWWFRRVVRIPYTPLWRKTGEFWEARSTEGWHLYASRPR